MLDEEYSYRGSQDHGVWQKSRAREVEHDRGQEGAIRTVVATKDSSKEVREQGIEKLWKRGTETRSWVHPSWWSCPFYTNLSSFSKVRSGDVWAGWEIATWEGKETLLILHATPLLTYSWDSVTRRELCWCQKVRPQGPSVVIRAFDAKTFVSRVKSLRSPSVHEIFWRLLCISSSTSSVAAKCCRIDQHCLSCGSINWSIYWLMAKGHGSTLRQIKVCTFLSFPSHSKSVLSALVYPIEKLVFRLRSTLARLTLTRPCVWGIHDKLPLDESP